MREAVAVSSTAVPSYRSYVPTILKATAWAVLLCSIGHYVRRDALHYLFHYTPDSFKAF